VVRVSGMGLNRRSENWRPVVVPVELTAAGYRAAHEAAHALAGVWNEAVRWVRGEWAAGNWGIDCPGCGALRMIYSLLHLDVAAAARFNALGLVAVTLLLWAYAGVDLRSGRRPPDAQLAPAMVGAGGAGVDAGVVCGAQLKVWTVRRAARLNSRHGDGVVAGPH
jgi:hypothetical protein